VDALAVVPTSQQGICHGYGADGVVGEVALLGEQLKVVVVGRIKLESATYNVSYNCS
jgi:hypothetical protein